MWLFVDESWAPEGVTPSFGILSGVLVEESKLPKLEQFLFEIRKKYYGPKHAKDYTRDIKGKELLSNQMVKLWQKNGSMPNNICFVKELLTFPRLNPEIYFKAFASLIYSNNAKPPDLLSPDPKRLSIPIRTLIENVSQAANSYDPKSVVKLIFDQRLGSQEGLAIAMKHFIAGIGLGNIHPYPYFAVSNICPGIQFADVFAYLLAKRAQHVKELFPFYSLWRGLQWVSEDDAAPKRYGLNRWNEIINGRDRRYVKRQSW